MLAAWGDETRPEKRQRSAERAGREPEERADLTQDEARVILEPYFLAARDIFCEFCESQGLGKEIRKTRFECRTDVHDTDRHFAGATVDGRLIVCAVQMPDLPEDTVAAIFAHEFGHVVDHLYPGRFILAEEELLFVEEQSGDDPRAGQVRVARARQWEQRSYHSVELTADLIAQQATGCRIGYSGKCMLQGLNRGVPRPSHLR